MIDEIDPSAPITGAHEMSYELPRNLEQALLAFNESDPLLDLFGRRFAQADSGQEKSTKRSCVISSWERGIFC